MPDSTIELGLDRNYIYIFSKNSLDTFYQLKISNKKFKLKHVVLHTIMFFILTDFPKSVYFPFFSLIQCSSKLFSIKFNYKA